MLSDFPVFYVLLHLKGKMAPGDFFSLIDDGSPKLAPAVKLLQVYGRDADREMLRDFYYQDDRRAESACLELEEAGQTDVSIGYGLRRDLASLTRCGRLPMNGVDGWQTRSNSSRRTRRDLSKQR